MRVVADEPLKSTYSICTGREDYGKSLWEAKQLHLCQAVQRACSRCQLRASLQVRPLQEEHNSQIRPSGTMLPNIHLAWVFVLALCNEGRVDLISSLEHAWQCAAQKR